MNRPFDATQPGIPIRFGDLVVDTKAIVFDKDGTLVAFDPFWAKRYRRAIAALTDAVDGSVPLRNALEATLGFSSITEKTNPYGPLASLSLHHLSLVAATVVHQHGVKWENAVEVSERFFLPALGESASRQDIVPIGDPRGLFARLMARGVAVMIATTDDRRSTVHTLEVLGVVDLVTEVVCGDDNRVVKPSPEAVYALAASIGIDTNDMVIVGDTAADLRMASSAGAKGIGVTSGTASASDLKPWATSVIASIDDIRVPD